MRSSRVALAPLLSAGLLVVITVVVPFSAAAQESGGSTTTSVAPNVSGQGSLEHQRDEVATRREELGSQMDVMRATDEEIQAKLADLGAKVAEQQALVDAARAAADAATADAQAAARAHANAVKRLKRIDTEVRQMVVEAIINPPDVSMTDIADSGSPVEARHGAELLATRAEYRSTLLTRQRTATKEADRSEKAAKDAEAAAAAARDAADAELTGLESQHKDQVKLAAEIDMRLEVALAEAGALSELDKDLAQEIEARQAALAAEAAKYNIDLSEIGSDARAVAGGAPVTWADVVKVQGIWVHNSIAADVDAMLTAAKAAGLALGGGGYRDSASQIALRRSHCGDSEYAIYQMPASQCSPPTARPGASMHERGLALDLQCSGALISTRSNPCFAWLARNAALYGFYNLPSEPWHWSVNGN